MYLTAVVQTPSMTCSPGYPASVVSRNDGQCLSRGVFIRRKFCLEMALMNSPVLFHDVHLNPHNMLIILGVADPHPLTRALHSQARPSTDRRFTATASLQSCPSRLSLEGSLQQPPGSCGPLQLPLRHKPMANTEFFLD